MAGLALYGDLQSCHPRRSCVQLRHRLESVKFLPDTGTNDRDVYGAVTARLVDRPEIEAADRPRVFMLAVHRDTPGSTRWRPEPANVMRWAGPRPGRRPSTPLHSARAIDDTDHGSRTWTVTNPVGRDCS